MVTHDLLTISSFTFDSTCNDKACHIKPNFAATWQNQLPLGSRWPRFLPQWNHLESLCSLHQHVVNTFQYVINHSSFKKIPIFLLENRKKWRPRYSCSAPSLFFNPSATRINLVLFSCGFSAFWHFVCSLKVVWNDRNAQSMPYESTTW